MDLDSLKEQIYRMESERAANGGCNMCGNCSSCPYSRGGYASGTTRRYLKRKNTKKCVNKAGKKRAKYWQKDDRCISYGKHLINRKNKNYTGTSLAKRKSKYKTPRGKVLYKTDKKNEFISFKGVLYILKKYKNGDKIVRKPPKKQTKKKAVKK